MEPGSNCEEIYYRVITYGISLSFDVLLPYHITFKCSHSDNYLTGVLTFLVSSMPADIPFFIFRIATLVLCK